jgi:predicted enzyme related to lactoylglutathione lyase
LLTTVLKLIEHGKIMIKVSVSIDVSNLKQGEYFYTEAQGCKKIRDQDPNMVVLATENCDIYLQEKEAGSKPVRSSEIVRGYERHWTPVHLDFLTDHVDDVVAKVLELGGRHEGRESGDWGSIAYCSDPFGNGFCLINE